MRRRRRYAAAAGAALVAGGGGRRVMPEERRVNRLNRAEHPNDEKTGGFRRAEGKPPSIRNEIAILPPLFRAFPSETSIGDEKRPNDAFYI